MADDRQRIQLIGDMRRAGKPQEKVDLIVTEVNAGAEGVKYRTSNASRQSNAVLSKDGQLTDFDYDASTYYAIEGYIKYTQNTGDFKFDFALDSVRQFWSLSWKAIDQTGNVAQGHQDAPATNVEITTMVDTENVCLTFSGMWLTHATDPGTIAFRWSQVSSVAIDTTIYTGSWMRLTRLGV